MILRRCIRCEGGFIPTKPTRIYCQESCRKAAERERWRARVRAAEQGKRAAAKRRAERKAAS